MTARGRLAGKGCLIVGGTGGIGLALSRRFLEEGARVVVTGRPGEPSDAANESLQGLGPFWRREADVASAASVGDAFRQALERLGGRLDVLFHVAGISGRRFGDGPLHECNEEGWDQVLSINARGAFLTNREAVRQMLGQERDEAGLRGTIVNTGSVLGSSPSPRFFGTYAYAASKGALRAMTMTAAAQYAPEGIRFNLLSPGLIDTPMAARAVGDPAIRAYLEHKQPLGAGPGTAGDIAEAGLYLCEPASRFVTGVELNVDGGWSVSEGRA